MRALEPDASGFCERDGVRLHWEAFGAGDTTIVLLPTWSVIPSRFWKAQVATLARRHRVVTFDGRGSGLSSRPVGAEAYTHLEFADDIGAVLDATGTDCAVLVALSCGATWGIQFAADHPERTDGLVAICPAVPLTPGHAERKVHPFDEPVDASDGWATYNRHYWERGRDEYRDFLGFFFGRMFNEPHSTKQIEDCVQWGLEIPASVLVDATVGQQACGLESFRSVCERVAVPVLVIHGDDDQIRPHAGGVALAEITGGRLVTIEGGGHGPQSATRSSSTTCSRSSSGRSGPTLARARGCGRPGDPSERCTSRRRSVSVMPCATHRSRTSCASSIPTSRSTGSPSTP